MIDDLESRTLLSAMLIAAHPDQGGEIAVIVYASRPAATSADPDEGGEADPAQSAAAAPDQQPARRNRITLHCYDLQAVPPL